MSIGEVEYDVIKHRPTPAPPDARSARAGEPIRWAAQNMCTNEIPQHDMKKLVLFSLLILILLSACGLQASTPIRVAYLVEQEGQLPQADLNKHPEILVTSNFVEFQKAASHRIALWIDKNAIKLVDSQWLDQLPQSSYPIIVIGYNDTLLSFRDSLQLCCFLGPALPDYSGAEPGFSVFKRDSGEPFAPITMLEGFKQTPTVEDILRISTDLLDGKIQPTATLPPPDVPTPTPP